MKISIKALILVGSIASLAACGDNRQQAQYQQQYQQPQVGQQQYQQQPQVVVQQAPQDNSSAITAAIGGAAIGALAANAFASRNQQPQVTQQVTEYRNVLVQTQPSTQKPYFKPDSLPQKPAVAPVAQVVPPKQVTPAPVAPKPAPSFAPAPKYKQSSPPRVSYRK
jgi:hypothetical protein